jgi:hypothetical protein
MLEIETHTERDESLLLNATLSEPNELPILRPSTVTVKEADVGMKGFGNLSAKGAV